MRRSFFVVLLLLVGCGPINVTLPPGSVNAGTIALPSTASLVQPPASAPPPPPEPAPGPAGGGVDQPSGGGVW